jgi:hypothetical protein
MVRGVAHLNYPTWHNKDFVAHSAWVGENWVLTAVYYIEVLGVA